MPGLAPGKAGVRQLFEMFHAAFDHAGVAVDDMIAEGDKVFVMARMTGTQRGEFMGIPPAGNTIPLTSQPPRQVPSAPALAPQNGPFCGS